MPDHIYIIYEGVVNVFKSIVRVNQVGREEKVTSHVVGLGKGELFGESCLFKNSKSPFSIVVESGHCKVYTFKTAEFATFYKRAVNGVRQHSLRRAEFFEKII